MVRFTTFAICNGQPFEQFSDQLSDRFTRRFHLALLGRITLAEYEQVYKANHQETEADETEKDAKDNGGFNDFDFDEDLMDTHLTKQSPLLKKKPTQGAHLHSIQRILSIKLPKLQKDCNSFNSFTCF